MKATEIAVSHSDAAAPEKRGGRARARVPRAREADATAEANRDFAIKLLENMVVPTFVLGADCRVLIWNHACERLTGIPADKVVGTRDHWRGFYSAPRPCLADLVALDRLEDVNSLYTQHRPRDARRGLSAENWCVMPHSALISRSTPSRSTTNPAA